jgi:uncharacterized protein YprB with RNaseH-like and TPR domain
VNPSKLADRLRGIVAPAGAGGVRRSERPAANRSIEAAHPPGRGSNNGRSLERVLDGEWRDVDGRRFFLVERRAAPEWRHGFKSVGEVAEHHQNGAACAPLLSRGAAARPPFMFFDLETTGLSGGAGTLAFLVGCGWFDDDGGFVTRQYLLTEVRDERPMLEAVAHDFSRAGALVSFNGKSFDAPLLETRCLFHRLEWFGEPTPHIDVLHPSRRFWRDGDQIASCSLVALEAQVLGATRVGDISGFEIPARYFHFVRSGDAAPLGQVLEHNRLDLLSLAGLSARLMRLVSAGASEAIDAREAVALGHLYARAGLDGRATQAFERALVIKPSMALKVETLRGLACAARRAGRHADAASRWRQLLDIHGCPPQVAREASEALAVHHEHRERDLPAAKAFALRSLDGGARPAWNVAVQHRLARIERKLERAADPGLLAFC